MDPHLTRSRYSGAVVRDAEDGDAAGLIALIDACWSEYPGCVLDVDGEVPELWRIASHFRQHDGCFWVVEHSATVIGCVGVTPSPQSGGFELHKLYVASTARGAGLGSRLVERVEGEAWVRGGRFVHLWSDTRFVQAHRLYERLGYRRLAETRALGDLSNTVEFHYRKAL